jgi:hypothetical protein
VATISGNLKNHLTGANVANITPALEMGDLTNWIPFGAHMLGSPTSPSNGAGTYQITYSQSQGVYPFVRILFRDAQGKTLEIAEGTASTPTIWDRSTPPTTLNAQLLIAGTAPTETAADAGGYDATPSVITGSVVDVVGNPRGGVETRLYGTTSSGERVIATGATSASGVFSLGPIAANGFQSFRLEFGPPAAAYDVESGVAAWSAASPPTTFEYVVDVPVAPAPSSNVTVHGTVRFGDGTLLPGTAPGRANVRVALLQRFLGQAEAPIAGQSPVTVGAAGTYTKTFAIPSAGSGSSAVFNLQVACEAEFTTGVWTEVGRSAIVPQPPLDVELNLTIVDERLRTASEATSMDAVDDALSDAGVGDDEISPSDEEILSTTLGIPIEHVRCRTSARRLKAAFDAFPGPHTDLSLEIYHALVCMRYPRTPRRFALRAWERATDAVTLQQAVARNILLPKWIVEPTFTAVLDDLVSLILLWDASLSLTDSLALLIRAASESTGPRQITDTQIQTLVAKWYERTSRRLAGAQFDAERHRHPEPCFWSDDRRAETRVGGDRLPPCRAPLPVAGGSWGHDPRPHGRSESRRRQPP